MNGELQVVMALLNGATLLALVIGLVILYLGASKGDETLQTLVRAQAELCNRVPTEATVQGATAASVQLEETLGAHTASVDALPGRLGTAVAQQVSDGMQPVIDSLSSLSATTSASLADVQKQLQDSHANVAQTATTSLGSLTNALEESHEHFAGLVRTLSEPGDLQQWLAGLQEAAEPLAAIQASVSEHYAINRDVLETVQRLVEGWAAQRAVVEGTYREAAGVLTSWARDEAVNRQKIEGRIMGYLEKAGEQSALVAGNLDELHNEIQRLVTGSARLMETTDEAVRSLEEIREAQSQVAVLQRKLAEDQRSAMTDIEHRRREMATALQQTVEQVSALAGRTNSELDAIVASVNRAVRELQQQHSDDLSQTVQALETAIHQHEQFAMQLISQQRQFMNDVSRTLENLPDRQIAKVGIGLLIAVVALQFLGLIVGGLHGFAN